MRRSSYRTINSKRPIQQEYLPENALSTLFERQSTSAETSTHADAFDVEEPMCSVNEPSWCHQIFGAMLDDPSTHDVTFKTSDGGSVSAHRAIVAAGSPVFHAMLYGNMKESNEKEIVLQSIDSETLKLLLKFMYTGAASFDVNQCMKLLEAANYFGVSILEVCCTECIDNTLDIETCCQVITFAHSKDLKLLVDKCFSFLFIHAIDVIKSPQFKDIPFDILLTFLESTDVHAPEIDLFLAVTEWYKHQDEQLPDITKSVFRSIRYPLISKHDLIHAVKKVKEIDSALYTSALEYHLEPEEYSGSLEQITPRQPCFEVISVTPDTVKLKKTRNETIICRVGENGWKGLCAVKVYPLEGKPVRFGLFLKPKPKSYNYNAIQFVLRSTSFYTLDCERHSGGINAGFLRQDSESEVSISLSDRGITAKIGSQALYAQHSPCYFCIHMHNSDDELVISYLQDKGH